MNIQYPITITNNVNTNPKCFDWMHKSYPITIVLQDGTEVPGITQIDKSDNYLIFNNGVAIGTSFKFKDPVTNLPAIISCRDSNNTRLTNYVGYDCQSGWLKWCPNCRNIMPLIYFDYNGRYTGVSRDQSQCSNCRSGY